MRTNHPIFQGPLKVTLDLTKAQRPPDYSELPGGSDLGDPLVQWRVQRGEPTSDIDYGLVSDPYGFEDSPDAEWISSGTNSKGPQSVALGRQGPFFLWGFAGDPTQMTESGRRVFLNALSYMTAFRGRSALVQRRSTSRDRAFHIVALLRLQPDDEALKEAAGKAFPVTVRVSTKMDPDRLEAHLRENLERLHMIGRVSGIGRVFKVDRDLVELGASNRRLAFFEAIHKRLEDDPKDALARRLLKRYARDVDPPREAVELANWLEANAGRLFFSDVGGYQWRLTSAATATTAPTAPDPTGEPESTTSSAPPQSGSVPELDAIDKAAARLASLELEWRVVAYHADTREVFAVRRHVLGRRGEHAVAQIAALHDGELPEGLAVPNDQPATEWWAGLEKPLTQAEPSYAVRHKGSYYTFRRAPSSTGADYLGIRLKGPPANHVAPAPLQGTYLGLRGDPESLGRELGRERLHRLRTAWGQSALIKGGSERFPTDSQLILLSPDHAGVPSETMFIKYRSLGAVLARVRNAKTLDELRSWDGIVSHRRVLAWMTVEGMPVLPRLVWTRAYATRAKERLPMPGRMRDVEQLIYVTKVGPAPERLGRGEIPEAIRTATVDIMDRETLGVTRCYPDGTRTVVRR